jgi:hypothetical protein
MVAGARSIGADPGTSNVPPTPGLPPEPEPPVRGEPEREPSRPSAIRHTLLASIRRAVRRTFRTGISSCRSRE